ncbi:hypothetical protein BDBG_06487 [Blastomyces gilchristii SLH14081]|uniref:Uncharacterized protein n=1 Tax=Blastomyces gilchristii (strain SLH14081) TaxID=559298 RepID=A0A179URE2_BLAGS|nr:uncharacterized protein BDBG_06487 [Blastomyces gilchristii SLH14081]OAT10675.1 hypothetical protein BDBG_06487 [Blastomyces gilchristii SLH14081]
MGYLERKIYWAEIAQGREGFNHQDARVARPLTIIEQLTLNAREADITAKVGNNWVRLGYQVGVAEPVPSFQYSRLCRDRGITSIYYA